MKSAVILSLVAAVMACGGDNCARQVTGTRGGLSPLSVRKADCTSFQATTVVPDATTVTVTVTVDPGEDEDDAPNTKRAAALEVRAATEIPTAVPAYASSCDSGSKYASACSCWGITAHVTTGEQPTKTETVTVTQDYCEDL